MNATLAQLLNDSVPGDSDAAKKLFEFMYADLKRLARSNLRHSDNVAELNTTVLVHEAFLKYLEHGALKKSDRAAFFAYVGRVMRSVMVDFVRERQALKRGGGQSFVMLTTNVSDLGLSGQAIDDERMLAIHDAMASLEAVAPALHQLIEMRFFAGLSVNEVADITGQSTRTVEREWQKARAILRKLMDEH